MLPVYNILISKKGIRAINDKIDQMLDSLFDEKDFDIKDIEYLFPQYLVVESPNFCINKFKEFRSIVKDNFIRDSLDPIYEYILYQFLNEEVEYLSVIEAIPEFNYNDYFDEKGNQIKEFSEDFYIENIEGYLEFLFEDYDFLSVVEGLESELEEYFELMPKDIRKKVKKQLSQQENNYENIILTAILNAIGQIESQPTLYENCSETQLNDHILSIIKQTLLEKNIIPEREKLQGFALKSSGETDFYFYDKSSLENIAIGESKDAKLFSNTVKQLLGYMTRNTKFGFAISINKHFDVSALKCNIINALKSFDKEKKFSLIKAVDKNKFIVSLHTMPENNSADILLFHLILNLNNDCRKQIAKEARI